MALSRLQKCVEHYWYSQPGPLWLLYPLELLYLFASRAKQARDTKKQISFTVPVLVVGNISVGGTGKTPTLIALANYLVNKGLKPGVISRGYGREANDPVIVDKETIKEQMAARQMPSRIAGDEPLLIFRETACPVSVHRDRNFAATCLLKKYPECDVILADDGLQHYKLRRNFELALIDAERVFGNGHLLPLGPLRESPERLKKVDWVLVNNKANNKTGNKTTTIPEHADVALFSACLLNKGLYAVVDDQECQLQTLRKSIVEEQDEPKVVALSAIGNPQSFYASLRALLDEFEIASFKDHHQWTANELVGFSGKILVCTSKDALKLRELLSYNPQINAARWYYLKVELELPEELLQKIYSAVVSINV